MPFIKGLEGAFDTVASSYEKMRPGYVELLGTYSDHIAIEEKIRGEFFAAIEAAINKHGGTFTVYDTIDLQLARK